NKDPRVTHIGTFLRKYKLDELPQLFNVIGGQMSLVGPRPEVRKYVEIYTAEQRKVLSVRPGITDYASLQYINENEMLLTSQNPEETYIREIMPAKIELNLRFIQNPSLKEYFRIIGLTIKAIIKN
ncbi:MAG: sugar transferase, partial [Bacteroidales bacterium]